MMQTQKILVLGGTSEANDLVEQLVEDGHDVMLSLAGRTRFPKKPPGELRIGGFGGSHGLAAFLTANGFTRLIDATHPFATGISANAIKAAQKVNIQFERVQRAPWQRKPDDNWTEVSSLEEACEAIPTGAVVFLALGSQHISVFQPRSDAQFIVRTVDPAQPDAFPPNFRFIQGLPAKSAGLELQLLKENQVTHLVCRNSGGKGAYAKIEAARLLPEITVIIQKMPD